MSEQYVARQNDYWKRENARTGGIVPDEYSYPHEPQYTQVTEEQFERLETEGSFWADNRRWL